MNVLVIGQGGREHAIVHALHRSPSVKKIYALPGNAGMAALATLVGDVDIHGESLVRFCRDQNIRLVVVGPEAELLDGVCDRLRLADIPCFGPDRDGAQLEGSKILTKTFLNSFNIPTARAWVVSSVAELKSAASHVAPPYVLKADGLCAGKGVFICKTEDELWDAGQRLFEDKIFGKSGERALLEEFLPGEEISYFVLTNGLEHVSLPVFRDHKRLSDGDTGPNTGGMGVVGPVDLDAALIKQIENEIVKPSVDGLGRRGYKYRGVLFIGIMLTAKGPSVLEYNVRFGDPETQAIMPSMNGDWAKAFYDIAVGRIPTLSWSDQKTACVVLAAEGYPESPKKGVAIQGDLTSNSESAYFLHAGTQAAPLNGSSHGKFLVNGGRVLNAIGQGKNIKEALEKAYSLVKTVNWPGMQYRKDIGKSLL